MTDGRAPRWSGRRIAATVLAVVLGGLALAWLVPPRIVEYGGGDEENYLANGVRQATVPTEALVPFVGDAGSDPSYRWLPPEWETLPSEVREDLGRGLLDAEGRMFRLRGLPPDPEDAGVPAADPRIERKKATVVDGRIVIAHDNLYATVLGGLVLVEGDHLPFVLNDVLLVASGLVFGLMLHRITDRRWAAWLGGALLVALPSMIEAARLTRTETFAGLLFLVFVWWSSRDEGESAWPGLVLVALWTTRHEFVVPLLVYLAWSALGRRRGGGAVVVATVAAAYLHPWGPASAGDLFPPGRDVFSVLPAIPAWVLLPVYVVALLVAGRLTAPIERSTGWLTRAGRSIGVHRLVWAAAFLGAALAEVLRRTLDQGQTGFVVLKGPALSTFDVLVDSTGWPLLVAGAGGLVWAGHRLAGQVPWIVALVAAPNAYVFVRMGASGVDLWAWSRRFHLLVYPLLVLGLVLLLVELVDRAPAARPGRVLAAAITVVVAVGAIAPHRDRPGGDAPTRSDADGFHQAVDRLGDDAVVVLGPRFGSQKSQLPIRIHGDRWSYVVWNDAAATDALTAALPCLDDDRAVYVETDVVEVAVAAGAEPRGAEVVLPARYNDGPGRDVAVVEVVTEGSCTSRQ